MFATIRRWIGKAPEQDTGRQAALHRLDAIAPLKFVPDKTAAEVSAEEHAFICREAVINRHQRIEGFEFSLTPRFQSRFREQSALARRVYDDAIMRNLSRASVSSLLGDRYALMRLSPDALTNPLIEAFFNTNMVILLTSHGLQTASLPALRDNLLRLRNNGVQYGWTLDKLRPDISDILAIADFIELGTTATDAAQLKTIYREVRAMKGHPKLLASGLQTADDFNHYFQYGFDCFSGPFAANRQNWCPAKSDIDRTLVIEVLNMVRAGAEFNAVASRLRTEPLVTFKLLRYINSPSMGLTQKITEVSQALVILGSEKFHRWLALLLFDVKKAGFRESVLKEQVLARARFMEMLAGQGRVPAASDQLFIAGLFSLMDVMMGQPIVGILKQVSLPMPVADALQGKSGPMRDALALSIAVETGTPQAMAAAATQCGLHSRAVTVASVEALAWAQQVSSLGE